MSSGFYDDATQWAKQTERSAKALLGALQFVVYSRPKRTGTLKVTDKDTGKPVENHINLSADGWYENLRRELEGEFKNIEGAFYNESMMRRDPRHDNDEQRDRFAHKFERHAEHIASLVFKAEDDIAAGVVPPNRQVSQALDILKDDLRKMVDLYTDHCYEMTFNENGSGLLALRARIVDGKSKAL